VAVWLCASVFKHRAEATATSRSRSCSRGHSGANENEVAWAGQHLADGFVAGHSWGEWQADLIKDLNKINEWTGGNISDVHVATVRSNTAVAHHPFRSPEIAHFFAQFFAREAQSTRGCKPSCGIRRSSTSNLGGRIARYIVFLRTPLQICPDCGGSVVCLRIPMICRKSVPWNARSTPSFIGSREIARLTWNCRPSCSSESSL